MIKIIQNFNILHLTYFFIFLNRYFFILALFYKLTPGNLEIAEGHINRNSSPDYKECYNLKVCNERGYDKFTCEICKYYICEIS